MTTLYRIRTIDCDGGKQGKTWSEKFFRSQEEAEAYQQKLISESNQRNPRYLYNEEIESIDGLHGYCNWQFSTLITCDRIFLEWKTK